ncbi:MAG TPA: hypothetical protein VFF96_04865 [Pseudoxanthomonas sp.]|nr:hypothetical protein [Pseudoxanthomonas sp.]
MDDQMHEHFLSRHAARCAVGKGEIDPFCQLVAVERRDVFDVLPVGRPDLGGQIRQCRHLTQVGRCVGVIASPQVRGKNPVDDMGVAQCLHGKIGDRTFVSKPGQGGQQLVVRPGLVLEQALQGLLHAELRIVVARWGVGSS